MKLLQSFKILQNLAADLGPVLALLFYHLVTLVKIEKNLLPNQTMSSRFSFIVLIAPRKFYYDP